MPDRVLTTRELNRALLARQMLPARETLAIPDAMERLVGTQGAGSERALYWPVVPPARRVP